MRLVVTVSWTDAANRNRPVAAEVQEALSANYATFSGADFRSVAVRRNSSTFEAGIGAAMRKPCSSSQSRSFRIRA